MKEVLEQEPQATVDTSSIFPRHVVELGPDGKPKDRALCGYLWDRVFVKHNGSICQECVDELRKRGQG